MDRFPQNCIIKIYYVNGISKEKLLSDQYFGVTSTCADPKALFVEKKGKKLRLRNEPGMPFGTWQQVVDQARELLGEEPEIMQQVLTVAGVGEYSAVYDDKDVVGLPQIAEISVVANNELGSRGLAGFSIEKLKETIAIYRSVVTEWDDETFPNDDHEVNDKLEASYFICPQEELPSTQADIDLYEQQVKEGNFIAQYELGMEYAEGILQDEPGGADRCDNLMREAAQQGCQEAAEFFDAPERYIDEDSGSAEDPSMYPDPEFQPFYEEGFYKKVRGIDLSNSLVEIKVVDQISRELLLMQEEFSLDDYPVSLQLCEHNGQWGLVEDGKAKFYDSEAQLVAACLGKVDGLCSVISLIQALAICGVIEPWNVLDARFIIGAFNKQSLNIFNMYPHCEAVLADISNFALQNGFAVSRQVAPNWKPGQAEPKFNSKSGFVAFVLPTDNAYTVTSEDIGILTQGNQDGRACAKLALARAYFFNYLNQEDPQRAKQLTGEAIGLGCASAKKFMKELKG